MTVLGSPRGLRSAALAQAGFHGAGASRSSTFFCLLSSLTRGHSVSVSRRRHLARASARAFVVYARPFGTGQVPHQTLLQLEQLVHQMLGRRLADEVQAARFGVQPSKREEAAMPGGERARAPLEVE